MRYGSLFSGVGGLDIAVESVFGATPAWQVELDKDAAKVLAARFPGVPNLGDVTAVDWSQVEPVDVLCGGFPCQDISYAGRGAGLEGSRSGLWWEMARAVDVLRPRWVVVENVAALRARGLRAVTHALASMGYVGSWGSVRASDVGAPHRRERLFVVASDPRRVERPAGGRREAVGPDADRPAGVAARPDRGAAADAERREPQRRRGLGELAGAAGAGEGGAPERQRLRDAAVDSGPPAPNPPHLGHERLGGARGGRPGPADRGVAAADADRERLAGRAQQDGEPHGPGVEAPRRGDAGGRGDALADPDRLGRERPEPEPRGDDCRGGRRVDFGPYAPAVERWERVFGRPAPDPVVAADKRGSRDRLNPAFVEWMMGFPEGWVTDLMRRNTDPRPDFISRSGALKMLGNAVVPQQGGLALSLLLDRRAAAA